MDYDKKAKAERKPLKRNKYRQDDIFRELVFKKTKLEKIIDKWLKS